jgi:hypothetical protein
VQNWMRVLRGALVVCVGVWTGAGCNGKGDETGDETGTPLTTTGMTDVPTTTEEPTTDGTTGGGMSECDPSLQDCPEGSKCTAKAKMADDTWNINVCVPEPQNGKVQGETCTTQQDMFTGDDDCAKGYICLNQQNDGTEGYCVEFCTPEMACPNTSGGAGYCLVANEGVLPICLDLCDPLTQDCPGLGACYVGDNNYICYGPDPVDNDGLVGDECNFLNACAKGLNCNEASTVNGCVTDQYGCCNPFCSLDEADPCTAPEVCTAVYGEMQPPGYENVGVCALPG